MAFTFDDLWTQTVNGIMIIDEDDRPQLVHIKAGPFGGRIGQTVAFSLLRPINCQLS